MKSLENLKMLHIFLFDELCIYTICKTSNIGIAFCGETDFKGIQVWYTLDSEALDNTDSQID